MNEYLGFIDEIGQTIDGDYIYRFYFTTDIDVIWGEYFNVTPAALIPKLEPDKNTVSKIVKVNFPKEMVIAKKNFCFSMQDCIDGIIPLIFSEIDENTLTYNDAPFFLRFGETIENVENILNEIGLNMYDIEIVKHGNDSIIDVLIDNLNPENEEDYNDEEDENF